MKPTNEVIDVILKIRKISEKLLCKLETGDITIEECVSIVQGFPKLIDALDSFVRKDIYADYVEFFNSFKNFSLNCQNPVFLQENVYELASSLGLFVECLDSIVDEYYKNTRRCKCCGEWVVYEPLSTYYKEMRIKAGVMGESYPETLNEKEYLCPNCGSSDRDRLIVSFLEKLELNNAMKQEKLLQIAPANVIEYWLEKNCKNLTYHSTDLFMDEVTFKSDIQDMNMVADGSYDFFICSHVLEHVQDDRKAMGELYRILSQDGVGIFLVPIDLNDAETDEEWGLSEEENWRRFGQGDHCRRYAKQDLITRLREAGFCVHELGLDYFGKGTFKECGLLDRSILYILTKSSEPVEVIIDKIKIQRV